MAVSPHGARVILNRLSLKLGFMLPQSVSERLTNEPPPTVDEFTDAVLVAEGLGPPAGGDLRRSVRALIAEVFRFEEQAEDLRRLASDTGDDEGR